MKTPPPTPPAPTEDAPAEPRTPYERVQAGELVANGMAVKGRLGFAMAFVDTRTRKVECQVPFFPAEASFFPMLKLWADWFYYGKEPPESVPRRPVSPIVDPATGQGFSA